MLKFQLRCQVHYLIATLERALSQTGTLISCILVQAQRNSPGIIEIQDGTDRVQRDMGLREGERDSTQALVTKQ